MQQCACVFQTPRKDSRTVTVRSMGLGCCPTSEYVDLAIHMHCLLRPQQSKLSSVLCQIIACHRTLEYATLRVAICISLTVEAFVHSSRENIPEETIVRDRVLFLDRNDMLCGYQLDRIESMDIPEFENIQAQTNLDLCSCLSHSTGAVHLVFDYPKTDTGYFLQFPNINKSFTFKNLTFSCNF